MTSFRIRPRFKHLCQEPSKDLETRIKAELDKEGAICVGDCLPGHINLKIPFAQRHFWSPQLNITIEEVEGEGTVIRGLYGPNPTVWAIFFFGYVATGVLIFFLGMWGLTRYSLGMPAGILWAVPVLVAVGIILYLIAQFGQKLGAEQMFTLHHFYEELVHDKISIT